MFIAGLKLSTKITKTKLIPGGKFGMLLTCLLGIGGCVIAFIVGFFPPSNVNVGSTIHYISLFSGGIIIMCLPAFVLMLRNHKKIKSDYTGRK